MGGAPWCMVNTTPWCTLHHTPWCTLHHTPWCVLHHRVHYTIQCQTIPCTIQHMFYTSPKHTLHHICTMLHHIMPYTAQHQTMDTFLHLVCVTIPHTTIPHTAIPHTAIPHTGNPWYGGAQSRKKPRRIQDHHAHTITGVCTVLGKPSNKK